MHITHGWSALSPVYPPSRAPTFAARQNQKEEEASWAVHPSSKRPTMSLVTHSADTFVAPAEPKPTLLVRLVRAVLEARTRTYLAAVTDPATGQIDPVLEQRVLRTMAL